MCSAHIIRPAQSSVYIFFMKHLTKIITRIFSILAAMLAIFFSFLSALPAVAQINSGLENTAATAGLPTGSTNLAATVGTYIKSLLGLVGVAFLILTVYAGILWMIARGEEDQVTHAKDILRNSIIGIIIIFLAYSITNYIVGAVLKGTSSS